MNQAVVATPQVEEGDVVDEDEDVVEDVGVEEEVEEEVTAMALAPVPEGHLRPTLLAMTEENQNNKQSTMLEQPLEVP